MITVTIARNNKKVMTLLNNGFSHSGQLDYLDNSLKNVSAAHPYGIHMEVWTKQDGNREITDLNYDELVGVKA